MNDENFANRVRIDGAEEILYAVSATQKLNSDIAQLTRRELSDGHVSLPAQHDVAIDEILPKIKAYTDAIDMDTTMFYESPYLETQAQRVAEVVKTLELLVVSSRKDGS